MLVAQGAKQLWLGGDAYRNDTSRFLITSLDLPADYEVLVASRRCHDWANTQAQSRSRRRAEISLGESKRSTTND